MNAALKLLSAALLALGLVSVANANDETATEQAANPFNWFDNLGSGQSAGQTMAFHPIKPQSWMQMMSPESHEDSHMAMTNPANYSQFMQPDFFMEFMNPQNWMAWMNPQVYTQMMSPEAMNYWMSPDAYTHFANPAMYSNMFDPANYFAVMNPNAFAAWANPETYGEMFSPENFMAMAAAQPGAKAE